MSSFSQQAGQLMVFGFQGTQITNEIKSLIHENALGSVILFSRNIKNVEQIRQLTLNLQMEAKRAGLNQPLMICTDQENGEVRRLIDGATLFPGSMLLGAAGKPKYAQQVGLLTALELRDVGINWNLAPVVDVNNNPRNPVINVRSFGGHSHFVAEMGRSFMIGTQQAGVISTLKHFPGHGDTDRDSHLDLPVIHQDMKRLQTVELYPFAECIHAGADIIMTAHVYFPAIENHGGLPATLSKKVITNLLRERMGFQGVITTDCMEMNAISERFGTAQGAVMALQAGADLIMVSHTYEKQRETINKVVRAYERQELSETSIVQSMERVHKLKEKYLNWKNVLHREKIDTETRKSILLKHHRIAMTIYQAGVTIARDPQKMIPLSNSTKTLFIYDEKIHFTKVEDPNESMEVFEKIVHNLDNRAKIICQSDLVLTQLRQSMESGETNYRSAIILTAENNIGTGDSNWINQLNTIIPVIVIAAKSPYVLNSLSASVCCICTYERSAPAIEVALLALFGKIKVQGKLPVKIEQF